MFHLTLPTEQDYVSTVATTVSSPTNTTGWTIRCSGQCFQLRALVRTNKELVESTRQAITRMTDRINFLIPDIDSPHGSQRRKSRGLFDVIGSASSYLFGTATEADTDAIKADITKIKAMAETAAADAVKTRDGMSTFTRLQNARLDTMHELLVQEHNSHRELYKEMTSSQNENVQAQQVISRAMLELARFVSLHDSVQELEFAVSDMIHGQLTPKLIGIEQLEYTS